MERRASSPSPLGYDGPTARAAALAPETKGAGSFNRPRPGFKNGKFPKRPLDAPTVASSAVAGSNPELGLSVNGLTHRDQRLANGGNQFSLEPPDQALCVGNGFVVEATNSVLRVRSAANGAALTGVQDINTFFGYPAAINRTTGAIGPQVIDPVCLYDPDNQRFIVVITTLAQPAERRFHRQEHDRPRRVQHRQPAGNLDRSTTSRRRTTEPTARRTTAAPSTVSPPGPCFQDYPHIGPDANGVYVSTNEYDLFGPSYNAAQIFAFSRRSSPPTRPAST